MARLIVTNKEQGVRYYEFNDGQKISLGREASNDIVLKDPRVSRVHASFYARGARFFVTDLFSRNGTLVNGEMVVGDRELFDQDVINVGSSVIVFEVLFELEDDSKPQRAPDEVTATGGFTNTKIAAAQFRTSTPFTDRQIEILKDQIGSRKGHNIFQDPTWALCWWHGSSLTKMAKETVASSIEIIKVLKNEIPSLNVFIFALSALLEEEEPTWKVSLMGDPIKICEEFDEILKSYSIPVITEGAIARRLSKEWNFKPLANIRFKKPAPSCELYSLEYDW